jgi:hypothetical protein
MSTSDEATKGLLPRSAQRPFIKHDGFGTPLPPPFGLIFPLLCLLIGYRKPRTEPCTVGGFLCVLLRGIVAIALMAASTLMVGWTPLLRQNTNSIMIIILVAVNE